LRPGHLRELTYRQVIAHYKLILCEGPDRCRKHWSQYKHDICSYDSAGYIHWSKADVPLTRRGLRRLLVAIGGVMLKHEAEPEWRKLYEANVWAWAEGINTWHVQFTQDMSKEDRLRAHKLGGTEARKTNFAAYQWMRGRNKKWLSAP
jgi:hypothetical protein